MTDLYRIRFKDGNQAATSALVWASSQESADALGAEWCAPRGYRYIGSALETVAREGEPLPSVEVPGVVKPIKQDKLPSAAVFAAAVK